MALLQKGFTQVYLPYSFALHPSAHWLAERELIRGGARKAIEVEWEIHRQRNKAKHTPILLTGIDKDAWEKSADFERAYKLVFKLDRNPCREWSELFNQNVLTAFYLHLRQTYLQGDRIIMIVADADNLQEHANFAKQLVQETNYQIESIVLPRVNLAMDRGKEKALAEFDAIQSLKARTKDIQF